MARLLSVVVLVWVCACATSRRTGVDALRAVSPSDQASPDKQPRAFVIAQLEAHDMRVISTANDVLVGAPMKTWRLPRGAFTIKDSEQPEETAARLHWQPVPPQQRVSIPFAAIDHVHVEHRHTHGGVKAVLGFTAILGVVVAAIVLVVVAAGDG